ncbi:hypothetical protein CF319_g9484 [Tilletia indica]|nr:hypothetical protein CF319_g9484 [Tilletia indica]
MKTSSNRAGSATRRQTAVVMDVLKRTDLPFKLHFDGWKFGFGAGFFTFVAATWCDITVLGLIIECVLAIVSSAFIGFFLICTTCTAHHCKC